jgi:TM2 domain-containing membrane protein YozV
MKTCASCGSIFPDYYVDCSKCGEPFKNSVGKMPGTSGSSGISWTSSVSQTSTITKPKSRGVALFLELLIPGAGFIYARSVGRGILVLVLTIAGVIVYFSVLQAACPGYYNANTGYCTTSIFVVGQAEQIYSQLHLFALLIAVGWLILRLYGAVRLVRICNER